MLSTGRGKVRLVQSQSAAALDADGHELVGWGMATGIWEAMQLPAQRPRRADRQW